MYELLEIFGLEETEYFINFDPLIYDKEISILREKEKEYYERYYG